MACCHVEPHFHIRLFSVAGVQCVREGQSAPCEPHGGAWMVKAPAQDEGLAAGQLLPDCGPVGLPDGSDE